MADQALVRSLAGAQDTIVALATAPGRSAIAIVRMSGPEALRIAEVHVKPWPLKARMSALCRVSGNRKGQVLDQALVTVFVTPESFTGEDLVEISSHGGHYVPARVLEALISSGARAALPGEFTRRAVLNGKLDITQAEAIRDLIDASCEAMHRSALGQLDGGLSRRIASLRADVVALEALIAYDIDFPEEDDGLIPGERIVRAATDIISSLDALLATVPAGEVIREGAVVVIAGEPNVGKSSLFNLLLGQSRAIVTEISGTTRDAIEGFLETDRWPLRLVDTAGLCETNDTVERIGIEVSERYLGRAHVVVACGDNEGALDRTLDVLGKLSSAPVIPVRTKADLILGDGQERNHSVEWGKTHHLAIRVSAETGEGMTKLLASIDEVLTSTIGTPIAEFPLLIRARHIHGIQEARNEMACFGEAWIDVLPAPVAAVHLRSAVIWLEEIIGAVSTDDVLDCVFGSFCVGK